jgi:putative endonuclease
MPDNIDKGQAAENRARVFLETKGFSCVARNYTCRAGEIDLIVINATTLVFVEVRYRKNPLHGTGAESVTRSKMLKIIRTANYFLLNHPRYQMFDQRFDVISIGTDLDWITNAFTLDD